jgi:hypothetical protein
LAEVIGKMRSPHPELSKDYAIGRIGNEQMKGMALAGRTGVVLTPREDWKDVRSFGDRH